MTTIARPEQIDPKKSQTVQQGELPLGNQWDVRRWGIPTEQGGRIAKYRSAGERGFFTGAAGGQQVAESLYGPQEQYREALQDILQRQRGYVERGADLSQKLPQQREQTREGRQLRGAQAGAGLRGGLAASQRVDQIMQNQLEREALDFAVKRQALSDYERIIGQRAASIQALPLAYGGLLSSAETSQQAAQLANQPASQPQGLLGGLFEGIFGGLF